MRDLLLLLCHYPWDEKNRETLSGLLGEVSDWHNTVELINAHGIIALAAYNIKEAKLEHLLPAEAMKILENGYMQSIVRNTWLTACWKEVNTILCNAGIKHVLLKGMALEHTLYDSKGLRQMNDNDILIEKKDALRAWNLLQEHGFKHGLMKSGLHKKIILDIGKHLPCLYKNGYAVEIHHALFGNSDQKNDGDPFSGTIEIMVDGTKAFIPAKEMKLRHLVHHFNAHAAGGDAQLRMYTDILLLDKKSAVTMSDTFITNPKQFNNSKYRKAAYQINFKSIPAGSRFRFLIGDIFPSVEWMKKRYRCGGFKAMLHYPVRMGKLVWII